MFAGPQAATATALGVPVLTALALQNVAASLLTMASPGRLELARCLCPDPPPRGPVLRMVLGVDAAIIAVLAVLALALMPIGR